MALVAPTEPRVIKTLGKVSSIPETKGADILLAVAGGLAAIQRKEISDLIASVHDGRLAKELAQMRSLPFAILIVEGRLKWSSEGVLLGRDFGGPWTRTAHRNLLMSVQMQGVKVESTDDANDTVAAVLNLHDYLSKKHNSLLRRPGPTSVWGTKSSADWQAHLLQGLDGVGPELADRIVKKFGRVPLRWDCDEKELMSVDGVGPKRAKKMMEALL
jgi:ERCC4-type nuclease